MPAPSRGARVPPPSGSRLSHAARGGAWPWRGCMCDGNTLRDGTALRSVRRMTPVVCQRALELSRAPRACVAAMIRGAASLCALAGAVGSVLERGASQALLSELSPRCGRPRAAPVDVEARANAIWHARAMRHRGASLSCPRPSQLTPFPFPSPRADGQDSRALATPAPPCASPQPLARGAAAAAAATDSGATTGTTTAWPRRRSRPRGS